jgi:hypothetical protein
MVMKLRIRTQHMIGDENVMISQLFHGLHIRTNGAEIGADFGLGKNGSNLHSVLLQNTTTLLPPVAVHAGMAMLVNGMPYERFWP